MNLKHLICGRDCHNMPQATHLLATDPRARATNLSLRLVRRLDVASASADALVDDYLATDTPVVLTGLLGAAPAERLATLLALARRALGDTLVRSLAQLHRSLAQRLRRDDASSGSDRVRGRCIVGGIEMACDNRPHRPSFGPPK